MTLFENDSILIHENKEYLLEIKERFSVMRDKPSPNRNISFTALFDKVS